MRATTRPAHEDDLDDLLAAAPERVLAWLRRKAALADGTPPGLPVADPASVRTVLSAARLRLGPWVQQARRGRPIDLWAVAEAVLLRELVGLSNATSALHLDVTPAQVGKRFGVHRRLTGDADYLGRLAQLTGACIQAAHGTRRWPAPRARASSRSKLS
jgi:hypothetical protein